MYVCVWGGGGEGGVQTVQISRRRPLSLLWCSCANTGPAGSQSLSIFVLKHKDTRLELKLLNKRKEKRERVEDYMFDMYNAKLETNA